MVIYVIIGLSVWYYVRPFRLQRIILCLLIVRPARCRVERAMISVMWIRETMYTPYLDTMNIISCIVDLLVSNVILRLGLFLIRLGSKKFKQVTQAFVIQVMIKICDLLS